MMNSTMMTPRPLAHKHDFDATNGSSSGGADYRSPGRKSWVGMQRRPSPGGTAQVRRDEQYHDGAQAPAHKHDFDTSNGSSSGGAEHVSPGRKSWERLQGGASPGGTEQIRKIALIIFAVILATACSKPKTAAAAAHADVSTPATANSQSTTPDSAPPPTFDSSRAMQYVKDIVAFGPRPIGSESHVKVENYIVSHLKGDDVERDYFEVSPTEGKFPVHNIIAKFPGTRDGIIVIASHYDTNWPLRNIKYVGANDGASSSAVLLEIANQLRGKKRDGYSVWLLWDDAEESMKLPWDDPESLYGVRHLAEKWQSDGTLKKMKAFILLDMIGDADLNIERVTGTTSWLEDLVFQGATRFGYQSHFFAREISVGDDYQPFLERGVPAVDLIDLDYGYNNVFHHTIEDTVDKLSPKSLGIAGTVTLETVRLLDQR